MTSLKERRALVGEQRKAFDRAVADVEREFGRRIRARRVDDSDVQPLYEFLRNLEQKGITRWWNDLKDRQKPSPDELIEGLGPESSHQSWQEWLDNLDPPLDDPLGGMGMSDAVQATFRESITRARRRELAALRCPDRYLLGLRMDDGSYRRLDELSGGQRVSVLLSLLLETEDVCRAVVGNLHPTLYGVMVFGRDPQNHPQTSSFFIQCAAYASLDRATDVVSVREIYRRILRQDVPLIPDSALDLSVTPSGRSYRK